MFISLGADEGSRHELHSPNEVEPKTDGVGTSCCCQSIGSTACTIDLEVFLPCGGHRFFPIEMCTALHENIEGHNIIVLFSPTA